jgi:hypothetical protein
VHKGQRHGPATVEQIRALLDRKEIEPDVQVWRTGMLEWKELRQSDLASIVATEPPPVDTHHIGNGFVWVLACLPLIYALIDAAVEVSNQQAAARSLSLGYPYNPSRGLPVQISFVINGLVAWLDYRRLEKAGYGSWTMRALAVLLTPVYLFLRAKRLKQRPTYGIAWIVSLVLGLLIYGSTI